jgi:hypothetical protein
MPKFRVCVQVSKEIEVEAENVEDARLKVIEGKVNVFRSHTDVIQSSTITATEMK